MTEGKLKLNLRKFFTKKIKHHRSTNLQNPEHLWFNSNSLHLKSFPARQQQELNIKFLQSKQRESSILIESAGGGNELPQRAY